MKIPQNRWFAMEHPTGMDDDWGYLDGTQMLQGVSLSSEMFSASDVPGRVSYAWYQQGTTPGGICHSGGLGMSVRCEASVCLHRNFVSLS